MKKEQICAVAFYIAAFCFYIAAVVGFATSEGGSMPVVWMCLGSANLCLGSFWLGKIKK